MRTHVRTPSSGQAIRGAQIAFKHASAAKFTRRRVVAVRAENENLFLELGTTLVKAGTTLVRTVSSFGTQKVGRKGPTDEKVVFVAGATGRLGAKIVKECLLAGLTVRAGVRDAEKGQDLVDTAKHCLSARDIRRLKLVEYDLFDEDSIAPAIGNAGLVVCAIGADEKKPFDVSAPKKVDGEAAIALVKSAARQGVAQFLMITSLGTTKFGWPASALNLFWGVLYHKKLAEQALQTSGMAYTIIRPGGMERPQDDYKETHNVTLAPRDTFFGGQVSRLQVAELAAACLTSWELSQNKVLEIVAETEAPLESYEALLEKVPQEISMEEVREKKALVDNARNKAKLLAQELEELEQELVAAEEQKINAENQFSEARALLQAISKESRDALAAADGSEREISRLTDALEDAKRKEAAARAVLGAQRRVARNLELLSSSDIQDITFPILNPGKERPQPKSAGAIFGGLFGGNKAVEEEEEVEEVAAPPPKRSPFSFFGAKAPEAAVEEEEEEVAAPPAPKRGGVSLFGAKAPEPEVQVEEEEVAEEVQEVPKRSAGLFGLFQQETVYAKDQPGVPPVTVALARPPAEVVERAVTKRGKHVPKRASVKELVPGKEESAPTPKASAAAPAPPATYVTEPEEPKEQISGFFSNLFGGLQAQAPAPAEPAADAGPNWTRAEEPAPKAAIAQSPEKAPVKASSAALDNGAESTQKVSRQDAARSALANMGITSPPPPPAAPKVEAPKVEQPAKDVAVAEAPKPVAAASVPLKAPAEAPKTPEPVDNAAEARAWIAAWRAKNKVKVNA